jgi:hypothetical protein
MNQGTGILSLPRKFGGSIGYQGSTNAPMPLPGRQIDSHIPNVFQGHRATDILQQARLPPQSIPSIVGGNSVRPNGFPYENMNRLGMPQLSFAVNGHVDLPQFNHPVLERKIHPGQPSSTVIPFSLQAFRRPLNLPGFYEVILPLTNEGLLLTIGKNVGAPIMFEGYRSYSNGMKGPAELQDVFINRGDEIITVDKVNCESWSIADFRDFLQKKPPLSYVVLKIRKCQV